MKKEKRVILLRQLKEDLKNKNQQIALIKSSKAKAKTNNERQQFDLDLIKLNKDKHALVQKIRYHSSVASSENFDSDNVKKIEVVKTEPTTEKVDETAEINDLDDIDNIETFINQVHNVQIIRLLSNYVSDLVYLNKELDESTSLHIYNIYLKMLRANANELKKLNELKSSIKTLEVEPYIEHIKRIYDDASKKLREQNVL